ncbi:WecB/TagA/CpsF family glycosyltransferase [Anaerovorax odorimutans]|uniref:WecB/TagA/CpsF family glycosyltransferase n=1 Tax=Anaerovorax odorimutans TaxID=109327 RepID=UPI00040ECF47|nr:WecB/TagA/CpsF family glycosyltransferase [Anaerovorax odorimutans]
MNKSKRVKILSVPVDMVNADEAMEIFKELMEEQECSESSLIVTPNSEIIVNAAKDKELKELIESAQLIIPDGIGIVYASKIMGIPLKERVTGIDFLEQIIAYLEKTGQSIYFLGSKPAIEAKEEGQEARASVAEMAALEILKKYPDLKIAGTHHGYFKESEESDVVEKINNSGADFLCVALGSPKQEKFVNKYKDRLNVKAAIGVGGSLDVWAGTLKRAPEFYQKNGLEWLYRLIQEPSRYKRMMALPLFMIKVILSKFTGGKK